MGNDSIDSQQLMKEARQYEYSSASAQDKIEKYCKVAELSEDQGVIDDAIARAQLIMSSERVTLPSGHKFFKLSNTQSSDYSSTSNGDDSNFDEEAWQLSGEKILFADELYRRLAKNDENKRRYKEFIMSTTHDLQCFEIEAYLGVVNHQVCYGYNFLKDVFTGFTDMFGGRSRGVEKTLHNIQDVCLMEMKNKAFLYGAHAVISIDFDFSEFHGGDMLYAVATGTAVKLKPIQEQTLLLKEE